MKRKSNTARIRRISKYFTSIYWVLSLVILVGCCNESNPMWFCLSTFANFALSSFFVKLANGWQ